MSAPIATQAFAQSSPVLDQAFASLLPWNRMESEKAKLAATYAAGTPFPHVVFDNFWDEAVLDRIIAEFPKPGQRDWVDYQTDNETKQTSRGLWGLSPFTQLFLLQVCSPPFLNFLKTVTGFSDLVPDPLYHGGGLHESHRGGWLNIHADWTKHPVLPLTRRLNMIVYLNRDWQADWGGDIELWDPVTKTCGASASPIFNRTLIFPTTSETLHGFPKPLSCPENRTRQSVSLFYWSMDQERLKTAENINFLPGQQTTRLKATLRSFVPPIAYTAMSNLRKKLVPSKG